MSISKIDGRGYTISLRFGGDDQGGVWIITRGRKGSPYFPNREDREVWQGARGQEGRDNGEPPAEVCAEYVRLLGYSAHDEPREPFNLVEMMTAGDEDNAFDQPCKWGHRVNGHAVYCHNPVWLHAPGKCRRHQSANGWGDDPWPHEGCAGFSPNPALGAAPQVEGRGPEMNPKPSLPDEPG